MDIRTFTWIDSFELTNTDSIPTNVTKINEPKSTQNSVNNKQFTMKIIFASIGGIVGTAIIMVCGFLIYKWNKKRKEQPIPTLTIPGTTTDRNNYEEHNLPGIAVEYNRSRYIPA